MGALVAILIVAIIVDGLLALVPATIAERKGRQFAIATGAAQGMIQMPEFLAGLLAAT